jgi:hypothetical protein
MMRLKATKLRGQLRSQVQLGNEGKGTEAELILQQAQDDGMLFETFLVIWEIP